jgi:hypothetical protein
MDFTTAGARGGVGASGIRRHKDPAGSQTVSGLAGNKRRIMSSFAGDPQHDAPQQQDGPVLVMPPPQQPKRPSLWLRRLWLAVFVPGMDGELASAGTRATGRISAAEFRAWLDQRTGLG